MASVHGGERGYLYSRYSNGDLATAQTVAFFTWPTGHIFLAFNMCSHNENWYRMG